jgi:hypothetical protein
MVMIHQRIHNLPLSEKQIKYNTSSMNSSKSKPSSEQLQNMENLEQKIALLEKQPL